MGRGPWGLPKVSQRTFTLLAGFGSPPAISPLGKGGLGGSEGLHADAGDGSHEVSGEVEETGTGPDPVGPPCPPLPRWGEVQVPFTNSRFPLPRRGEIPGHSPRGWSLRQHLFQIQSVAPGTSTSPTIVVRVPLLSYWNRFAILSCSGRRSIKVPSLGRDRD